ncbi:MAG: hypothetical protein FJZ09_06230 [Candidatus Omnitrophica bacterium]|nr:hypothetical protein [Candidatus Omnitrophota bacterium]
MPRYPIFLFCVLYFCGCATAPMQPDIPVYSINGINYLPLVPLCNAADISWQYDSISRTVTLDRDAHRVSLRVGDSLIMVNGLSQHLNHPVEIYQGTIVVPSRFRDDVLDALFKGAPPVRRTTTLGTKLKKVIVDAGHGGKDPGAIGRTGIREKDVNLDISRRLASLLRAGGVEVVMTRTTDVFITLEKRVDIANSSGVDLFISVHSNANPVRSMNGFEVYYVSPSIGDAKRANDSARVLMPQVNNVYFSGSSLATKAIVWDLIYTHNRAESKELSHSLCRAIDRNLDANVLGAKGARYYVLKGARVPAVLIEVGFLSNTNEEKLLKNNFYRQKLAESIFDGLEDYAQEAQLLEIVKR